jgi:hypothetical protein
LLPYNSLMAAMDYFVAKFPNHSPSFSFLLALSFPMLLVQVVTFMFLTKIHLYLRITMSLFVNAIITVLFGILAAAIDDEDVAFYSETILVFLFGSSVAFL